MLSIYELPNFEINKNTQNDLDRFYNWLVFLLDSVLNGTYNTVFRVTLSVTKIQQGFARYIRVSVKNYNFLNVVHSRSDLYSWF